VVAMSHFNWKEFNDVGNHLNNFSKEESYQRSAIGRYYYSCFGTVKEYYEKSFRKTLSSTNAHKTLIKYLLNSPFIEEQEVGNILDNLRNNRNYADYNSKKLCNRLVSESKKDVEKIFSILNDLHENPLRIIKN
jgi:hypothetical protein